MSKETINLSELFYSVQGEGVSSGVPAFFLRFFNCNLSCGMTSDTLQEIRKLVINGKDSYSQEVIDLMIPSKDSEWVCDSIPVWVKSNPIKFQDIIDKFSENELVYEGIISGLVHLIWTGGEPLLKVNQDKIIEFFNYWEKTTDPNYIPYVYNEIETNGTQYITDEMFDLINQINCSVKLKNSGHSKGMRIVPSALERIMEHHNYWFKFVISKEEDIEEIFKDFMVPFSIPPDRIILMPALSTQKEFHEKTKFILELSKKYQLRSCQRLHISAWDQVIGV